MDQCGFHTVEVLLVVCQLSLLVDSLEFIFSLCFVDYWHDFRFLLVGGPNWNPKYEWSKTIRKQKGQTFADIFWGDDWIEYGILCQNLQHLFIPFDAGLLTRNTVPAYIWYHLISKIPCLKHQHLTSSLIPPNLLFLVCPLCNDWGVMWILCPLIVRGRLKGIRRQKDYFGPNLIFWVGMGWGTGHLA